MINIGTIALLVDHLKKTEGSQHIKVVEQIWKELADLKRENRQLHDELAMLHTIITDSYERRGTAKKQGY
jgi:AmiR/NasT family two-component response regulator